MPSRDDSSRPLYAQVKFSQHKNGGVSLLLRMTTIDGHAFDDQINLVLGTPALQTEAEDRKRVIDLQYNLFSTLTLAQLKAMTNDTLRVWLNTQTNAAYRKFCLLVFLFSCRVIY